MTDIINNRNSYLDLFIFNLTKRSNFVKMSYI